MNKYGQKIKYFYRSNRCCSVVIFTNIRRNTIFTYETNRVLWDTDSTKVKVFTMFDDRIRQDLVRREMELCGVWDENVNYREPWNSYILMMGRNQSSK